MFQGSKDFGFHYCFSNLFNENVYITLGNKSYGMKMIIRVEKMKRKH